MNILASKITLHMVSSLDGIIAKKDNSVSWFETVDHYDKGVELTPEDSAKFLQSIDCYVMGARTYEHALELSKLYGWVCKSHIVSRRGRCPANSITYRPLRETILET